METLKHIPVIPAHELTIFPNTSVSLDLHREKAISAVNYAVENKLRAVILDFDEDSDDFSEYFPNSVGTMVEISKVMKMEDDVYRVLIDGISVVETSHPVIDSSGIIFADVTLKKLHGIPDDNVQKAYKDTILNSYDILEEKGNRKFPKHIRAAIQETNDLEMIINIATGLITRAENRYQLLTTDDLTEKADLICGMLADEISYASTLNVIENRIKERISNTNKEFLLREHMRAIQEELGDDDENAESQILERIDNLKASSEVKAKMKKELERLGRMSDSSPEASIIRNWLDWVLDLPWGNLTKDETNLKKVMDTLNADHYGIDKVKKRVVEYLAVRILSKGVGKGTALCLVGPPGVGKTSIAQSIAKALGKEYISLTLGGVHDEAEIRGHRKTYIGAMPGRIMSSLSKSKSNNPLFLLDEVDKITKDMRGDPSAALLEVLDSNQNKTFRDNYLEIPYDLSDVMFVLTANDVSTLDKPLLDRLEIIEMEGYTVEEKTAIAQQYLIAKQAKLHGLNKNNLIISPETLRMIIERYTMESGVRELERQIATLCRHIAYNIVVESGGSKRKLNHTNKVEITQDNLTEYLGAAIYGEINESIIGEVGKVTGLAWTPVGGQTLDIEVSVMPGKGELKLTGKLGDVMKESAMTALSVVRARSAEYGVDEEFYNTHDIHLHVPKGATPKDGPSAGVSMATAILSAVTKRKVADAVAMTGEISLNGRVMAIGGLKEKSLAAHRSGVKKVFIPKENIKDLENIPESVKEELTFLPVDRIEQIFSEAVCNAN